MRFLVFGTGPQGLGARGAELRHRLSLVLGSELRAQVDVVALSTYGELARAVGSGVVSVAWLPPAVVVEAQDRHGASVLVRSARHGATEYRSALFVRKDEPAERVEDMMGGRAAWVDPDSCSGYLFARLALIERGIVADAFFREQSFAGSHAAVARAVRDGDADIGASYAYVDASETVQDAGWARVVELSAMRTLVVSPPLPTDAICASAGMDPALRDDIRALLERLHEVSDGSAVLQELFQADRFVPAGASDFASVRRARQLAKTIG